MAHRSRSKSLKLTEEDVGTFIYVWYPKNKRPVWRWIVDQREDGRFIVRSPIIGTLLNQCAKMRDKDFNKETLFPKDGTKY